jgi:hypothetical protein
MDSGILTYVTSHSALFDALGVIVTAVATIVLAVLTALLWIETRRLREASHASDVVVTLEPHRSHPVFFNLVIENVGQDIAADIRLSLDREVVVRDDRAMFTLNDFHLFQKTIPLLKSHQKIENFVGRWYEGFPAFSVTVIWTDRLGRAQRRTMPLDVGFYKNNRKLSDDPLRQIAESQKKTVQLLTALAARAPVSK